MKTDALKTLWMFKLGSKVIDLVTGFSGIVTARVEYLNGCRQYCVTPSVDKEGKKQEHDYIDETQLAGDGTTKKEAEPPGGVMSNEPKF